MPSTNKSPLRYPGGKTRACKPLDAIINKHFNIKKFDTIVSPFFGGGSFEFHIQNLYNLKIVANDKFKPLYVFWEQAQHDNNALCNELYKRVDKIDKTTFKNYRDKIMEENNTLEQAVMYFAINRCSFSGATLSGGFSEESAKSRFTTSSIDRINKLRLDNFEIYNMDFEDFINEETKVGEKKLIFLDPPYYLKKTSKLYGKNGDMHERFDHEKLFRSICKKKNWIMTYNNCEYIRNLYKNFTIIETEWKYGMNKNKTSSEIVIIG